jgi:hypothetical protein
MTVSLQKLPDWKDHIEALSGLGGRVIGETAAPDDPICRQESWHILFSQLVRGYLAAGYADPDYPEYTPLYNAALNLAAPNPDFIYYGAPVDGTGTYRLRGLRGTNRFTFIQFSSGRIGQAGPPGRTTGGFSLDDLTLGPDGAFDVLLSAERPAGHSGDWIRLDPETRGSFIRMASYDWLKEQDSVVGIERLDRPARRPRVPAEQLAAALTGLPEFIEDHSLRWWRHMGDLRRRDLWNRLEEEPWGAFEGQVYYEGLYRLADDEALLLETDVPKSGRYWGFLVCDMQFRTIDWVNHQSSLNAFQARIDSDGKFRAVICNSDPGAPNWLDTGGFREGAIQGRWNNCESEPVPTTRLVKLSELRRHIPADTPVVTPAERDRQLRDRRLGAQLRRKW